MRLNSENNDISANSSSFKNNTIETYDFFKSDSNFYTVLVITVSVFIILGIVLLVCLICKPSYWKGEKFISHPIEFLQDSNHNVISRSEFSVTNTTIKRNETVNAVVEYDNQTNLTETSIPQDNGNMSVLSTYLPPLISQTNNHVKPKQIKKLQNALDRIENHQEESVFKHPKKASYNELDQLDITSLTHMDDGFD